MTLLAYCCAMACWRKFRRNGDFRRMTHLVNQVAVVTGANSGIGKAITLALAAQGATVCLVGRRMETLQSVAEQVSNGSVCYQADLERASDIAALIANVKQDVK